MGTDGLDRRMIRKLKTELLLAENIRTLLYRRNLEAGALAVWCGHEDSWISKIIGGTRGVQIRDLGKIADFFGLTVAELFQHGIAEIGERRTGERRTGAERRGQTDRRQYVAGSIHPDVKPRFPPRRIYDDDGRVKRIRARPAEKNKDDTPRART